MVRSTVGDDASKDTQPPHRRRGVRVCARYLTLGIATLFAALTLIAAQVASAEPRHGIAMHGEPALPAGTSLPYVNPQAPKGGVLTFGIVGSFDSLNPFIIKGAAARGLRDSVFGNNVFESLLERSYDEPFSLYGLLAETVDMPDDRSWVEFTLNPKARFSDGNPVTVDDVIFSFEVLRDKGRPNNRSYYGKVATVERKGEHGIRFSFPDANDRELPLILGLMPILPAHKFDRKTFEQTTLEPLFGSGPYTVAEVEPGSRIVLQRNPDYWAADLPIKAGMHNFDTLRFDYFRDQTTLFEAFKKGLVDVMPESDPGRWASGYDIPAVADGRIIKEGFETGTPKGMFGFVFNTRRTQFADARVREAFGYLFDFAWVNTNLYFDLYKRTTSYFEGSELASTGRAADERERELLGPFDGAVRADILEGKWLPPTTDGSGRDRKALREAVRLLGEAGWRIKDRKLVNEAGEPFSFEVLIATRDQERLALAFSRTLTLIGMEVNVRSVDSAQYQRRVQVFDYDMILTTWYASLSPGNEQSFRWSVASADQDGTFNFAGAREPALDAMIAAMLSARARTDFVSAVRAFDRVLLSGFYVVPLFHLPDAWVARWRTMEHPSKTSLYGNRFDTWWHGDDR